MRRTVVALLVLPLAAGCLSTAPQDAGSGEAVESPETPANVSVPSFAEPLLIDPFRAGGEPVVEALADGTVLVASHPGWTHVDGADPGIAAQNGQVHLWRSGDGGLSFAHVGLGPLPVGPRDEAVGVSDPDLSVGPEGRVYLSQLWAASTSISRSTDGGETWEAETAPFPAGDRNWVETGAEPGVVYHSYRCGDLYRSTDGGRTWTQMASPQVDGNLAVGPDGTIYCRGPLFPQGRATLVLSVSTDRGEDFTRRVAPWTMDALRGLHMNEPAVDAAGNVYLTWADTSGVWIGSTPDDGRNWSEAIRVSSADARAYWPWAVAGSPGRAAVVWLQEDEGAWHVEAAIVLNATSPEPRVVRTRVTPEPVHEGRICQQGTACQTGRGGRALGDFFTADVGPDGRLHVAVGTTEHTVTDGLSHPLYVRQTGGPRLIAGTG